MTQPGNITNMNNHYPSQPADAIIASIASIQVNAIRALVPMAYGLIVMSSGGIWQVSGGAPGGGVAAAITTSNLIAQPQSYNGIGSVLQPIVVNYDILYVQDRGSIVRDLSYNFYVNVYTGTDVTARSNHLFQGRQLVDWAYAEEPFKIIWAVRDDGILLSFTYLKEQEISAWTRHDTLGTFTSVCSVSEQLPNGLKVNATYFAVERTLNGARKFCIERLADRELLVSDSGLNIPSTIENSWSLDCALALPQGEPNAYLFPGQQANVAGATNVQFISNLAAFTLGSIGSVIRAYSGKAVITGYMSATLVTATIVMPFPVLPNDPANTPIQIAPNNWTLTAPVTTVTGLSYMNGSTVGILADGNVLPQQVVSNGAVTLPFPASSVLVGLPFQCQMQTLYLDVGEPTIQGKRKKVNAVTIRVQDGRGIKIGRTFGTVVPVKQWNGGNMGTNLGGPLQLYTGDGRVVVDPVFDTGGQICIQIDDPVPATVLAVIPEITLGDTP